jgi:hypothetical protein
MTNEGQDRDDDEGQGVLEHFQGNTRCFALQIFGGGRKRKTLLMKLKPEVEKLNNNPLYFCALPEALPRS